MTYKTWLKQYTSGIGAVADFAMRALRDAKKDPKQWDFPSNKFEGRYQALKEHLQEIGESQLGLECFKETFEAWQKHEKSDAAQRKKKAHRRG